MRERLGWLVIASADGLHGYGECAPLPEAGTEPPADAERRLGDWCTLAKSLTGHDPVAGMLQALSGSTLTCSRPSSPSADFAVESALLDLRARQRGLPLRRLLQPDAADDIAVNATLGAAATVTPAQVSAAYTRGYRVLKIKVGLRPADEELPRLLAAAHALPSDAVLRLDANGAWDEATAGAVIARLAGLPMDGIEEPLREPNDAALGRLVLKPGVIGGLRSTLRLAHRARDAGREVVLTSLIESAAGLWVTAQLAGASASPLAHGLATADWLARDLGRAPEPEAGRIVLPRTPGSGFEPTRLIS